MCAMPVMPREGGWTVDDLDDLPDDGLQYELADGVLLVSPSPRPLHQIVAAELTAVLRAACPPTLRVLFAPLDFRPSRTTSLQPDVLVVRREDAKGEQLTGTPLLVVEILSPATRAKDLVLKRSLYATAGVPSYWIVDPAEQTLLVLRLDGEEYAEVLRVAGEQVASLDEPMPVSLAVRPLLD